MGYPTVNLAQVDGFLKVYNSGGLFLLFDAKSKQAMVDFANVALKSYVLDLVENAKKLAAQKAQAATAEQPPAPATSLAPAPPPKGSLILTDL